MERISHSIQWPMTTVFYSSTEQQFGIKKTSYKFYNKEITTKICFKMRDSFSSCIVLSKYRCEQVQNSAGWERVLFKHSVFFNLNF